MPFYCNCLQCEPDPDDFGLEEVFGLGAQRFWWIGDFDKATVREAYVVGGQTTDRGQVESAGARRLCVSVCLCLYDRAVRKEELRV